MKKTDISLFICALSMAILFLGCKLDVSNTKYLDRPDVLERDGYFEIISPYISANTESITIYRQNVHNSEDSEIERVAILFPKGIEDSSDQTLHHDDRFVLANEEYRYYLRFTDKDGSKNRTEWSDKKVLPSGGAMSADKLAYTVTDKHYVYDAENMTLTLDGAGSLTAPSDTAVIADIASYNPALVFQAGEEIKVFEITTAAGSVNAVQLQNLLTKDFFYKDIRLLGILGQKTEKNSKDPDLKKTIMWTKLAPISVTDQTGKAKTEIKVEPPFGKEEGNDYSTTSDNEN